MDEVRVNGVPVEDTFAEAFRMRAARVIVTAETPEWARTATRVATGYATSVIGCDAEAGVERELPPAETLDGRPGGSLLVFGFNTAALGKALVNRIGQCVMTCPTTACFNGLPQADERVKVGGLLRFFGDGHQASKKLDGRRYWRVPVMDGEFLCEETFGVQRAVAGGNFLILGADQTVALAAAEAAVGAIRDVRDVVLPFPGGVVRSGSKVGSRYKALKASTNEEYCPTLRGRSGSRLPRDVNAVYEIVIDGLDQRAVETAMRVGIHAAAAPGVLGISAGNYGGKLGQYHLGLHEILQRNGSPNGGR
jgi:formylmethanofuran--tetrahydromethanopterin N-formyltransferase